MGRWGLFDVCGIHCFAADGSVLSSVVILVLGENLASADSEIKEGREIALLLNWGHLIAYQNSLC